MQRAKAQLRTKVKKVLFVSVLALIEQFYKYLLQKDSEYKLYVLGANSSQKILRQGCNNIIISRFVEDLNPYFERARLGIVPLL
ncbi:hypothetical protein NIES4071_97550 [Calothrix sp. NIES-4071]|nr:hypothetical protein NIES4071_97550 [Calothrix sp. NIES-4071]BAZ64019.1 hypothetical protein NIES4105_97480 [Calothrix sp. NIES-4105]